MTWEREWEEEWEPEWEQEWEPELERELERELEMVKENYFTLIASTYYCLIIWIEGIRGLGIIISTLGFPFYQIFRKHWKTKVSISSP